MAECPAFIPLNNTEFGVGKTIQRSIYDMRGNLLLSSGATIATPSQLHHLIQYGLVEKTEWDTVLEQPQLAIPTSIKTPPSLIAPRQDLNTQMDDVRWYVGETLHMQALVETDIRFVVKLIGYIKGKSVLVTAPIMDGKYAMIRDSQAFVVRGFQGKKAFAFTVMALKSVFSPHPYLHLSYPKQISLSVIRQNARAQVHIIASVTFKNPNRTSAATLVDLSLGGTSGIIKQNIAEMQESGTIAFKINVVGNEGLLSIDFIVRSLVPAEDGESFRYGFEFQNLTSQNRLILSAFVHQTIAEQLS